jgi:hypothetical protein
MTDPEMSLVDSDEPQVLREQREAEVVDEASSVEESEVPEDYFFGRFGTFMLIAPERVPSADDLRDGLEQAIRRDNRIVDAMPVSIKKEWISRMPVYPRGSETTDQALLSNEDKLGAIRFRDPIAFTVKIPIKNQPPFRGIDDIPTDTYYAAWDGITAVVLWQRKPEDRRPPRSGGHIVIDVLRDIAKAAGLGFYAQACSPGCTNLFAHRVMRIERVHGSNRFSIRGSDNYAMCADVHVHSEGGPDEVALGILRTTGQEGYTFAIYKNYARRIRDLEVYARSMVNELLALNHERIERSKLPLFRRFRQFLVKRSDERRVRLLMSSLWLALARIEAFRTDWLQKRSYLNDLLDRFHYDPLYDLDRGDDDNAIMSQDLSVIGSAVEQTANRMDARALAWTTGLVALAGLVGAVIGGLLTALLTSPH